MSDHKIKLLSKKLSSGKYQVKFQSFQYNHQPLYGYILVEPKTTLKEVTETIQKEINSIHYFGLCPNSSLFSIDQRKKASNILIFKG